MVDESLAGAESVAAAKGVRLGGHVDDGVLVRADPDALTRVIGNLLMNAIRHTPADGSVQVQGRAGQEWVELSVSDGCGGIPDDEIDRVFEVAFRGSGARTPESSSGAGLGLAIVRGIVEAHRGRVEVHNADAGCRFLVRIPAQN
jgi:signal transduction histidine kinase